MLEMAFAGGLLLITHFGLSSTSLRSSIVGVVGEQGFQGLYSLVAMVTLGFVIWTYVELPRTEYFWFPNPDLYWLPKILMPIAAMFAFGGFFVRNPTQIGREDVLEDDNFEAAGLMRITRHPFMWGVLLWALSHLAANGDVVSVVFFATFGLLAGIGTVLMDRKQKIKLGQGWEKLGQQTSNVPFVAILAGRNKFVPKELIAPVIVGVVVHLAFYFGHEWLSGVPIS